MQSPVTPFRLPLVSALLLFLACLAGGLGQAQERTASHPVAAALVHPSSFPRILVWLPQERRVVEQALSETIVRQGLDRGELYYKIVDDVDAFEGAARSGVFNVCVIFEPQETVLRTALLKGLIRRGQGIVVVGAGAGARAAADELGVALEEPLPKKMPDRMTFAANPGINLSGSISISGKVLYPRKQGSVTVAAYEKPDRPAALLDMAEKGRLLAMPFSLTASAYRAGSSAPYSLLLRAAVLAVVSDKPGPGGPEAEGVTIASPSGQPVSTRVKVTVSPGSRVLWANAGGRIEGNTISFEVQANRIPRNLYYLYMPKAAGQTASSAEIFAEQDGKYLSQGIIR